MFGKTKTGFKIGGSVGIIILLLGITIMFGVYQSSKVSNEIIIISQEYAPLSEIISDIRINNAHQGANLEKIIRYSEAENHFEYEKAKDEFVNSGEIIKLNLEKGKKIANAGLEISESIEHNESFIEILDVFSKISQNYFLYETLANELMEKESIYNEALLEETKKTEGQLDLLLEDSSLLLQRLTERSTSQIEINEQESLTGQIAIITMVGAIALILGFFISQINNDLKKEVELKTNQLQRANKKLKKLDQMKNEFIGIASHELRSPIQPILGFAELAKAGDIDQKEAWDGVLELGTKLQDLANAVLDVSKIESNRLDLYLEKVRINDLILQITSSQKINLKKPVIIREKLDENILVEVDRVRISQVFRNLMNNAIKFTQKGSITIESHVYHEKNRIQIKITDTGAGIPDDVLDRIFEKFVTKSSKYEKQSGTGLGLFLCKGIIKAHGGNIKANNNFERGATFEFTLPISNKVKKVQELSS